MLTADIRELLNHDPGVLFITIGNSMRSDDGVGVYIGDRVIGRPGYQVLNAYDKPENIIDEAVSFKPKRTVIIDAADFRGEPGEARVIDEELIPKTALTTHAFPVPVLARMLAKDTGCEVIFIGIQAKSVELGEGLSAEVKKTADAIIDILRMNSRIEGGSNA